MTIETSELIRKLQSLKPAIPTKEENPAQNGVLFKDDTLYASRYSFSMSVALSTECEECFVIPPKAIDLINALPKGQTVTLTIDDQYVLSLISGKIKSKFTSFEPETFHFPTELSDENSCSIKSESFISALKFASFAMADDKYGRDNFKGVHLCATDGNLGFVATDGYRLQWASVPFDGELVATIPSQTVLNLLSLGVEEEIELCSQVDKMTIRSGAYFISTPLLFGEFLDYKNVFATQGTPITVHRDSLLQAIGRATICVSNLQKPIIGLDFQDNALQLCQKDTVMEIEESLTVEGAEDFSLLVGFNARYLTEALKSHKSEHLTLHIQSATSSTTIETDGFRSLILPVRLKVGDGE